MTTRAVVLVEDLTAAIDCGVESIGLPLATAAARNNRDGDETSAENAESGDADANLARRQLRDARHSSPRRGDQSEDEQGGGADGEPRPDGERYSNGPPRLRRYGNRERDGGVVHATAADDARRRPSAALPR